MLPASMFFEFIARNYMLYSMPAQNYRKLLHCASKLLLSCDLAFKMYFEIIHCYVSTHSFQRIQVNISELSIHSLKPFYHMQSTASINV